LVAFGKVYDDIRHSNQWNTVNRKFAPTIHLFPLS